MTCRIIIPGRMAAPSAPSAVRPGGCATARAAAASAMMFCLMRAPIAVGVVARRRAREERLRAIGALSKPARPRARVRGSLRSLLIAQEEASCDSRAPGAEDGPACSGSSLRADTALYCLM